MNFHRLDRYLGWLVRYHALAVVASLVLFAVPVNAAGDELQLYAGTVGSGRIVMELEGTDDDIRGRYFYRKYRLDIGLRGARTGDGLSLESPNSGDRIMLRRTNAGLSGTLTTKDARRLAVRLSPITANAVSTNGIHAKLADQSAYGREQLVDLELVAGDVMQHGARTLRNWREPVSGIALFRIENGYPAPVLEKINAALETQHWERVSQWFTCEGYDGAPGMEISEARDPFLSDDFFSYAWFANWSCAGTAHPDFGTQGYTFDARSGRELSLEDSLYLGVGRAPEADTSAFYAYRSEVFAPRVVTLLTQLYPEEIKPAAGEPIDDACDYADPSVWDFPSWYLTREGLYLGAYFARVQRPCDEPDWSVIPWQYLTFGNPSESVAIVTKAQPDSLRFGDIAFIGDDIARLSQDFNDRGIPVLDVALQPEATKRLETETIRLVNTDVTIAVGSTALISARLVEPITKGLIRISGRFSIAETQAMAGQVICALRLSPDQYDPPSLARNLPCKPGSAKGSKP